MMSACIALFSDYVNNVLIYETNTKIKNVYITFFIYIIHIYQEYSYS